MTVVKFSLGSEYVEKFKDMVGKTGYVEFETRIHYDGKDMMARFEIPNANVGISKDQNGEEQVDFHVSEKFYVYEIGEVKE